MTTDPNYDSPVYGFTGEPTDDNGLLYLRARYYNPNMGVFTSLDPFEGVMDRAMSLNGYSWVEGNVLNMADPSGMIASKLLYDFCDTDIPPTPTPKPVPISIKDRIVSATVFTDFCVHSITSGCQKLGLGTLVDDPSSGGVGLLTHTHHIEYYVGEASEAPPVEFDEAGNLILPPNTYEGGIPAGNRATSTLHLFNQLRSLNFDIKVTGYTGKSLAMDLTGSDWALGGYSDTAGKMHIVPGSGLITGDKIDLLASIGKSIKPTELVSAQNVRDTNPDAEVYFSYWDRGTGNLSVSRAGSLLTGPFTGMYFIHNIYAVYSDISIQPGDSGGGVYAVVDENIKYIGVITARNTDPRNGRTVLQFAGI